MHQARTGVVSPDVVSKACEPSSEKALCVSVLKSQTSDVNDLKQAAVVAIQAASGEAVTTSEMIKAARKREENKEVVEDGIEEETLADCAMSYISLMEILANASGALSAGPGTDVKDKVTEAVTTVETCEKSIAGGRKSPMVEEVAKKNENVRKLCSNALSVYNVYVTGK
ncbi:hypothetical protein L1987_60516 [Smallanthus sonchifolius]|uniref:Uncharacterized protein n=1 Tax=Smallanthus sonchifolius TaxID=185202 RepID=A0ACB9D8N9_9ASTR|nr:hypothetical protein L1987_60516 [Smallanthus sonchifolius]